MRTYLPAVAIFGLLTAQAIVWGQARDTRSTSSGMFGSRTLGRGLSAGSRTFGRGSSLGNATTTGQGNVGQVDPSARFMRSSRQPGDFVGTSSDDVRSFIGAVQAGQNRGRRSGSSGPSRGNNRSAGVNRPGGSGENAGRGGRTSREVRISLRVAFDFPQPRPTTLGTKLAQRLTASARIETFSPVTVVVRDGTATLRGVVATDHDRDLCEQLARLEAGVWEVQNELVVAVPPAPETLVPPAEAGPATPGQPAAEEKPADDSPAGNPVQPTAPRDPIP